MGVLLSRGGPTPSKKQLSVVLVSFQPICGVISLATVSFDVIIRAIATEACATLENNLFFILSSLTYRVARYLIKFIATLSMFLCHSCFAICTLTS